MKILYWFDLSLAVKLVTALITTTSEEIFDAADFMVSCKTMADNWQTSFQRSEQRRQYWDNLIHETVKRNMINKTTQLEFEKYFETDPTEWGIL